MKLAASNIAWSPDEDDVAIAAMKAHGFMGIEIAPTMTWDDPTSVPAESAAAFRSLWTSRELPAVSMQALLYGRADLLLFSDDDTRRATTDYLRQVIKLGEALGVTAYVFGSPKNRRRGEVSMADAAHLAIPFFRDLGAAAIEHGAAICIEANPPAYGCDFITSTSEAAALVAQADHPGFRLHLDTGGMAMAGEDPPRVIEAYGQYAHHFHASEPYLAPVGTGPVDHAACGDALKRAGYEGWVTVEMKRTDVGSRTDVLRDAFGIVAQAYR